MRKSHEELVDLRSVSMERAEQFLDFDSESVTAQEAHHAMHSLTFFLFMGNYLEQGRSVRRALVDRVIYHLLNLREFIQDAKMGDLVTELSASLSLAYEDFFPGGAAESVSLFPMTHWFELHEHAILELARHYGKEAVFQGLIKAT